MFAYRFLLLFSNSLAASRLNSDPLSKHSYSSENAKSLLADICWIVFPMLSTGTMLDCTAGNSGIGGMCNPWSLPIPLVTPGVASVTGGGTEDMKLVVCTLGLRCPRSTSYIGGALLFLDVPDPGITGNPRFARHITYTAITKMSPANTMMLTWTTGEMLDKATVGSWFVTKEQLYAGPKPSTSFFAWILTLYAVLGSSDGMVKLPCVVVIWSPMESIL